MVCGGIYLFSLERRVAWPVESEIQGGEKGAMSYNGRVTESFQGRERFRRTDEK